MRVVMFVGSGLTMAMFIPTSSIHPIVTYTAVQAILLMDEEAFI